MNEHAVDPVDPFDARRVEVYLAARVKLLRRELCGDARKLEDGVKIDVVEALSGDVGLGIVPHALQGDDQVLGGLENDGVEARLCFHFTRVTVPHVVRANGAGGCEALQYEISTQQGIYFNKKYQNSQNYFRKKYQNSKNDFSRIYQNTKNDFSKKYHNSKTYFSKKYQNSAKYFSKKYQNSKNDFSRIYQNNKIYFRKKYQNSKNDLQ